jgi:peptide/nickel transport system permease protein
MVNAGRSLLYVAWWISTFPALMIMGLVLAVNLLGDGLRDILDPHLQV